MEKELGKQLLAKYLSDNATEREKRIVEEWYAFRSLSTPISDDLVDYAKIKSEMWEEIEKRENPIKFYNKPWIRLAAAVLLILSFWIFFDRLQYDQVYTVEAYKGEEIKAGGLGAILTLTDGSKINLESTEIGEIAIESGVTISKTTEGFLAYKTDRSKTIASAISNNILTTSKGETYQVLLPDGSKVWLNSASLLSFPSNIGERGTERIVRLEGEGYFEIANASSPFIVETSTQKVKVLGTHFNIDAYTENLGLVKTTLIEGKVNVLTNGNSQNLMPGEQAINERGNIAVHQEDVESVVAWKNGYFKFDGNIIEIMSAIGRWYDVDVTFSQDVPKEVKLWGYVSRSNDLISVLRQLERTNQIKFKIKGREIIVTK